MRSRLLKTVVTGGMIFSSKCTKKHLEAGLRPRPLGDLKRSPRLPSRNKGVLLLRGGQGSETEGNGKEEGEGKAGRGSEGKRGEKRRWEERKGRKGLFPLFLFYESTTGMVPIMGPIQTLCARALTELATPLHFEVFNAIQV